MICSQNCPPKRGAKPRGNFFGKSEMVVFVGKSQNPFLTKSRLIAERSSAEPKLNARAGKKEGGWGERIFARPRFRRFFFRHRNSLLVYVPSNLFI
ncbi:MAG: hypothetical protein A2626_02235 [Candidatus Nealsonbacteria bacterium RIFCSPHIGHO2_01_FULL_38_55]|uniref:Uncharacterized protein n=1 Tax=Candidatus Nealsonbacteria bacterium RIFCSPHIGHO2_01_FULL_38_55 TaxID=1801664 RepID=A0A1G2E0V6_9BACT|nr:MAG: hypothetical protein A2626_02235 [Candidatus Nealsonbacteria bacterium RIFCSPHIGHO2_01_FULL_38_55]